MPLLRQDVCKSVRAACLLEDNRYPLRYSAAKMLRKQKKQKQNRKKHFFSRANFPRHRKNHSIVKLAYYIMWYEEQY